MANQHTSRQRTNRLIVRFSENERAALDARATAAGADSLADYIRAALGLAEAPTDAAPTCRQTWCRHYGQRHATEHEGGE